MKINNETKIGILAVVGVAALIFGYSFLKGTSLIKKEKHVFAIFEDIQGLTKSNPVVINGLQIGNVASLDGGKDLKRITVTVHLTQDVNIPNNSLAVINPSLLGAVSLEIKLGNSNTFLKVGDTLLTTLSAGAFDEALKIINPVLYEVKNAVKSLDSVLHIITGVFDPSTKNNIKSILENLSKTTASFSVSASSLQTIMNPETGELAKTLKNASTFSSNLAANSEKINGIMANAQKATGNLANLDFQKTLTTLDNTVNELQANLKQMENNINSKNGSLGLLMSDTKLYDNLSATSNKLNILIDDIRVHPKRYVNISVFGKKDKGDYLTGALVDDSTKAVPHKKK